MALHLTPEIIVGAYDFLRATPPFNRWRLPEADDVEFRVVKAERFYGQHEIHAKRHLIMISAAVIGHTGTLLQTMAHEMVHAKQALRRERDVHGASFKRMAAQVCRYHGFDPKAF